MGKIFEKINALKSVDRYDDERGVVIGVRGWEQ